MRALLILAIVLLAGCIRERHFGHQSLGLIEDPDSGLYLGSTISGSILVDPAMLPDPRVKVSLRNTSGDAHFDLRALSDRITAALVARGWEASDGKDFGVRLDVNIMRAVHLTPQLLNEFEFLDSALATKDFMRPSYEFPISRIRTQGWPSEWIADKFRSNDTYAVVAAVHVAVRDKKRKTRKVVTFSRSTKLRTFDESEESGFGKWRRTATVMVATYAGGWAEDVDDVAEQVRERFGRIVADVI